MDMHDRDTQILGHVLFSLGRDQPFFFLDTVQQAAKEQRAFARTYW